MKELSQAELAAIYRALSPDTRYYGDEPEAWTRRLLLQQIRVRLAEKVAA